MPQAHSSIPLPDLGLSPALKLMALPADQRQQFFRTLGEAECERLMHDWDGFWARANQIIPEGRWRSCVALAGRGWGKTRVGAEWIRRQVTKHGKRRIALVAQDARDGRDVMVEGETGLRSIGPEKERPKYEPSKRRLTWPNGATATLFADEEPEQLRGPQHDCAWVDELAKFRHARDTIDNLEFGLRLGTNPQVVYTTTPKPTKELRELLADPQTITIKGTTYENMAFLAPGFIHRVLRKYEGTRLGRQELLAEILGDTPGALWRREEIEAGRVERAMDLTRIVVAVDPSATSGEDADEAGIVGCGIDRQGHGHVIADRSRRDTPLGWARAAVELYRELTADIIVAEKNNGGEMVSTVIHTVDPNVPVQLVWASRGKAIRAQPVASLYEQGRIHHAGRFPDLEDELCTWTPMDERSPNRLDALVWGFTWLYLEPQPVSGTIYNDFRYQISPF